MSFGASDHHSGLAGVTVLERTSLSLLWQRISYKLMNLDRLTYHEAGHVVVAHYHRYTVTRVTIEPVFSEVDDQRYLGRAEYIPPWPDEDEPTYPIGWSRARTIADVILAGRAAEVEVFGNGDQLDGTGDSHDLETLMGFWYEPMTPSNYLSYARNPSSTPVRSSRRTAQPWISLQQNSRYIRRLARNF